MNGRRRVTHLALTVLMSWLLVGCGADGDAGAPADDEPTGGEQPAASGDALTVSEALATDGDEPVTVRGFLVDDGGHVRICEVSMESYPPQCGDPSLEVEGVTVAELDGAQSEGEVTWVDQATLTGEVGDGVLRASDATA